MTMKRVARYFDKALKTLKAAEIAVVGEQAGIHPIDWGLMLKGEQEVSVVNAVSLAKVTTLLVALDILHAQAEDQLDKLDALPKRQKVTVDNFPVATKQSRPVSSSTKMKLPT